MSRVKIDDFLLQTLSRVKISFSLFFFLMCKYIFENKNVAIDMIYVKMK